MRGTPTKVMLSSRIKARPLDNDGGAPYRSVDSFDHLTTSPFPDCVTLDDLFKQAVRRFGSQNCFGTREVLSETEQLQENGKRFKKLMLGQYHWMTFEEVQHRVDSFGQGLLALGLLPRQYVLLFAETRAEWMIAVQAAFKYNFPVVTLYATLGDEAIVHGINESQVEYIVTSTELIGKFKTLLKDIVSVRHIIYMDDGKTVQVDDFPSHVHIHSMSSVQELGARPENGDPVIQKPVREDLAVIMYTSGSTGQPKGVMMTHNNLMCGLSGQIQRVTGLGPSDIYIGYLPLAHVLELTCEISCNAYGVPIGYSSAHTLTDQSTKIMKGCKGDASELKPTLMAAVPLIMDRLYKAVWTKVNEGSKLKKALFTVAYDYKSRNLQQGRNTPMCDKLVFQKIRDILGGRVRLMLSGGAPLSSDTQRFMNVCFCCSVSQGYGLTETCGAGTVQETSDISFGRCGSPLFCNQVKLTDWVEGGYTTKDKPYPRGEIMIGGGNVALGYYKQLEKTAADFVDVNGMHWFCTGDIGQWHPDGCLQIIDRKKDLVKLQVGEYVALSKVETVLKLCNLVDNVCAYADSAKMYSVCLVVPNDKSLVALARRLGIMVTTDDWQQLCDNLQVEKAVLLELQNYGRKGKLASFEIPQRVKLCTELWTPDTGLVTAAFKLKRKQIQTHYASDINRMYA
ncbi:Long-chain-fatty-acid--CoA ligase 4 [Lamellibrachia satsuma]|nr:Long-chain-fatty-acid--CoA ligase 4 [Lamellibrachia satsuma]